MSPSSLRAWLTDIVVGGFVGTTLGAIVAVNMVIYSGVGRGYESSLPEIFRHSTALGVLVVATLLAGPVVGVLTAHTRRIKRSAPGP